MKNFAREPNVMSEWLKVSGVWTPKAGSFTSVLLICPCRSQRTAPDEVERHPAVLQFPTSAASEEILKYLHVMGVRYDPPSELFSAFGSFLTPPPPCFYGF